MIKTRIGILIKADHNPIAGGGFSYYDRLLKAIDQYSFDPKLEFIFIYTGNRRSEFNFSKKLIQFHPFEKPKLKDYFRKFALRLIKGMPFFYNIYNKLENIHARERNKRVTARLKDEKIDILYYLDPEGGGINIPFVTTHWDIGHCSTHTFPELAGSEAYEARQHYYNSILPRALAIFAETNTGKEELVNYTSINPDRIYVIPIFPGSVVIEQITDDDQRKILDKLNLKSKHYLFYPAQFWAHKNHTILIDAIEKLQSDYPNMQLVFTGSDQGNLNHIKKYIFEKNITQKVHILGFVNNQELFTLYKNAIAMVMPSYLGPSNMPPLEAAFLNCPALISNLKGHVELLGEYGKYFDPTNLNEFIVKLKELLDSEYISKPFDNAKKHNIDNALYAIEQSFLKIMTIRKNWE